MARLPKHVSDIDEYKTKLENQYRVVLRNLEGSKAELSDAKKYFVNPDEVTLEDAQYIRVIDSTDLTIACKDMKGLMDNIIMKFAKRD